jgi:tRNA pseudouridine38-40 synthase
VLSVVGQSFVLHQIRKMVAASVDVARGAAPPDAIATLLGPERAQCPMAPGVGLYLCQPYFDGYNDKYAGSAAGEGGKEGYCGLARDAVDTEGPGVAAAVDAFKAGVVLPGMAKQEAQRSEFIAWLANLHRHKASWYRPFDLEKENGGGGGYGYGPQE